MTEGIPPNHKSSQGQCLGTVLAKTAALTHSMWRCYGETELREQFHLIKYINIASEIVAVKFKQILEVIESQNQLGQKRPLKSLSLTINHKPNTASSTTKSCP